MPQLKQKEKPPENSGGFFMYCKKWQSRKEN